MDDATFARSGGMIARRAFLQLTPALLLGKALASGPSDGLSPPALFLPAGEKELSSDLGHATVRNRLGTPLVAGWEYHQGGFGGIWEVWRKVRDSPPWQTIEIPHCFNAYDAVDPDSPYYQGPGWYRNRLKIENPYTEGRTLLHFEGAGQRSEVYVYTERVASHTGGYDEFTVDITEASAKVLKNASNKGLVPLAVLCDNSRDLELIPSNLNDFTLYGGLYRRVHLMYAPAVSLEGVHIDSRVESGGRATVRISARLYNPAGLKDAVRARTRVIDSAGRVIHTDLLTLAPWPGFRDVGVLTIDFPSLWSTSKPSLYVCEVHLESIHGESRLSERFGIRACEFVKDGPFKLNGERLLLRGTHRHEDHAGLGAAMRDELIRQEMTMIKEMGANFVRLGHYQQSRTVLDLCDELGLLAWEEIPWTRGGVGGDRYKDQARNMLRSMIDQHRNHPSIIIWGLGNENDWPGDFAEFDKEKIRGLMRELNDLAHQLDPARHTAARRCDFCKDIPDVYSPSIWRGWYHGRYTGYRAALEQAKGSVDHLMHVEWGGESHARRHSEGPDDLLAQMATRKGLDQTDIDFLLSGGQGHAPEDGDWSETYICNLFDWHLKEQETMDWLAGSAQWTFKDFSTPLRPENPIPRVNQKGLVERDLTPKEGYFVFQSYWSDKPMVRIYGHSWPIRWGEKDQLRMVKVYSNCPSVELFLNDASCGTRQRNSRDFPAAGLRWMVKFKEGENQLRAVARKAGSEITDQIRVSYKTQQWDRPARLILQEIGRSADVVAIQALALDGNGVVCLDARNSVRFGLAGDGRLVDNLGTSTGSRKIQLYNGRAIIRAELNGGRSVVSASSGGLPTAFLTLGGSVEGPRSGS